MNDRKRYVKLTVIEAWRLLYVKSHDEKLEVIYEDNGCIGVRGTTDKYKDSTMYISSDKYEDCSHVRIGGE